MSRPAVAGSVLLADSLYIAASGEVLCGSHSGTTAQMTGRDLDGGTLLVVDHRIAAAWFAEQGEALCCETCGKRDGTLQLGSALARYSERLADLVASLPLDSREFVEASRTAYADFEAAMAKGAADE